MEVEDDYQDEMPVEPSAEDIAKAKLAMDLKYKHNQPPFNTSKGDKSSSGTIIQRMKCFVGACSLPPGTT